MPKRCRLGRDNLTNILCKRFIALLPALLFVPFLEGCGIAANMKKIPPDTPLAQVRFTSAGEFPRSDSVAVFDNKECRRDGFSRFKSVGLVKEVDVAIPADRRIFILMRLHRTGGNCDDLGPSICYGTCASDVSFFPQAGRKYSAELVANAEKCITLLYEESGEDVILVEEQVHNQLDCT